MKKVLIPIDGTPRSLDSISFLKTLYGPQQVEIHLLTVIDTVTGISKIENYEQTRLKYLSALEETAKSLSDYKIIKNVVLGAPNIEILKYVNDLQIDMIIMTRSTKKGLARILGSVTANIVKSSPCAVAVVPETK